MRILYFRTMGGFVAVVGLLLVLQCQLVQSAGESRFLLQRSARGIDVGSGLISEGLLNNGMISSGDTVKESGTCEETYGFLPCTTSAVGNLFLLLVYGYLMFQAATMLSNGSELLLAVMGPGIIGGLFLPILGAFPDALLILVSGLSGSKETAQQQVLIGMGLLAGSTVMLLTALWGSCLTVGKCDLSESTAIDSHDTKGFSLFGSGITTDGGTSRAAQIMVASLLPFIIVEITLIIRSSSGKRIIILVSCIIAIVSLLSYCIYQQLTSLKNRENEGMERLERMDDLSLADRQILSRAGLLRVAKSRQMVMDLPLLLEMLATWDVLTHVFHLPGGDLTITPRLVRRITGLPDHGPAAVLDSAIRGMEEKQEAHRFFTGAAARVQRRGIPWAEIARSRVPELRKAIALVIMHRISHSTNYYDVPCGWMRAVERAERGERLNWAALVARGMITRLDALAGRARGDYPYCSILMCILFDFFPRTAPRGPQRVLTAVEPCINRWERRWRRGGFPADRFAGGASVRELRAGDLVADPYADVAWASDTEEAGEPEDRPETPEHSGDGPSSAEGSQDMASQGQAPPTQEESVELADSDQEETEEEISRRLEGYFPGIEHHRLLAGAPPVAEAGHAWERAAMARDVIRALEIENARQQGQIIAMREERRERHGRPESKSRSTGSRHDLTVQQRSGQASRGEPSQGMLPPS